MAIQREIERKGLVLDEILEYEPLESPMWFGAEGREPKRTLITDEPLIVTSSEHEKLSDVALQISDYISSYSLEENGQQLGIKAQYLNDSLVLDGGWGSQLLFGGLDVYLDKDGNPKVLEINSSVQAMGLQDTRMDYLGISYQPRMIDHFVNRLQEDGYEKVMVLGSRKNPFWRSHLELARIIGNSGMQSAYGPSENLGEILESGFVPDVFIRRCNSKHILYSPRASKLRELVSERQIPFINSLSSASFGTRGFLGKISKDLPNLFPSQVELGAETNEDTLRDYPWLKLEASNNYAYVVNFNQIRKWARDGVTSLIKRDFVQFEETVGGKNSGDAKRLKLARDAIIEGPEDEVKWIAQEDIEPPAASLDYNNELVSFYILHRVYWVRKTNGEVSVSLEGFGCTEKQFSQSKGKINAGTGVSVPITIDSILDEH